MTEKLPHLAGGNEGPMVDSEFERLLREHAVTVQPTLDAEFDRRVREILTPSHRPSHDFDPEWRRHAYLIADYVGVDRRQIFRFLNVAKACGYEMVREPKNPST